MLKIYNKLILEKEQELINVENSNYYNGVYSKQSTILEIKHHISQLKLIKLEILLEIKKEYD